MNAEDMSLRANALLRRAGLSGVPRSALIGLAILGIVLILACAWQFWPRPNPDFIVTGKSLEAEETAQDEPDAGAMPAQIVVDVEGAVVSPGLYTLVEGSRVGDAVEAAGGLRTDAALGAANLAQRLTDGEQIYIRTASERDSDDVRQVPTSHVGAGNQGTDDKININTASAEELQELSGVGPSLSERIIQYRKDNGPFSSVEEIQEVSGIGETRFANIKDRICV